MNRQHNNSGKPFGSQGSGYQRNSSHRYDPTEAERMRLKGEMRNARQELARLDAKIASLKVTGQQIDADIAAHQQSIPQVALMEIGRLASNAIGFPFLPPAYRNWYYRNEKLHEIRNNLKYQATDFFNQREALTLHMQDIQTDLDLLKAYPDQY